MWPWPRPRRRPRVDESPQVLNELRCALGLVEDHELVLVLREVGLRLGELGSIGIGFETEIVRDLARRSAVAPGARPTTKPAIGHRGEPSVSTVCRTGDFGSTPWIAPDRVSPYTRSSSVERTILDLHHNGEINQ